MRLEVETGGKYAAEDMRPDLADTFKAFRQSDPQRPTQEGKPPPHPAEEVTSAQRRRAGNFPRAKAA